MPDAVATTDTLTCRAACGACCTAPSITSPIPGMPAGKPAGVRCVQLDEDERCRLFGQRDRPAVCGSLRPSAAMCGASRAQAMHWLTELERQTAPVVPA
ncbi:MAG: YkgJ family cysteine cluster protein [Burkholderiales bacterium]|nr:YkgJ family cysteine cluster protein [Burkholderiales bacterium]